MAHCAECQGKYCREGDFTKAPKDCPSLGTTREGIMAQYQGEELEWARKGAGAGDINFPHQTRVEEIMDFAHRMGYKKLGLAFCIGLSKEAAIVSKIFRANGFQVESTCCKIGSVPKSMLGCAPEEGVMENGKMCHPIGQAETLDKGGCELNVILGLCVGHDTLFLRHSKAPVTVLATKEWTCNHDALAPVRASDGEFKRVYSFIPKEEQA